MNRSAAEAIVAVINNAPRRRPGTGAKLVGSDASGYMVIAEDHTDGYDTLQITSYDTLTYWLQREGYDRAAQ